MDTWTQKESTPQNIDLTQRAGLSGGHLTACRLTELQTEWDTNSVKLWFDAEVQLSNIPRSSS